MQAEGTYALDSRRAGIGFSSYLAISLSAEAMLRSSQNPLASPLATQPQGRLGQARVGRPGARASDGVVSPGGGGGAPEELVCLATMVFAGGRKRIVLRDASVRVAADRELGPGVEVIARCGDDLATALAVWP